jgi:hypothetical protein
MTRSALIAAALAMFIPALAQAHGGDPLAREALRTDDMGGWVLVTNFGIMRSDDLTHYVCEEAFLGGDDFRVVALGPTRWITFSRAAIMKTDDGCSFRQIAPLTRAPAAAAAAGERVIYASNADGARGLFLSGDGGERFAPLTIAGAEAVIWTGLGALADGAFVASGYDSAPGATRGDARLWRIEGASATPLALPTGAKYPYLMAAGGAHVAGVMGLGELQVAFWIGADGAVAQHTLERWPGGMALDARGQTLHIAGATQEGGLWRGVWSGGAPTWEIVAAAHPARCVTQPGDTPLLCASRMTQDHDLSALSADGSWEALVRFQDLLGPQRGCPAGSQVRQVCPAVWDELAVALRVPADREPPEVDPPAPDMGAGGSDQGMEQVEDEAPLRGSAACSAAFGGQAGGAGALGLVGALWALRTRSRRGPRR